MPGLRLVVGVVELVKTRDLETCDRVQRGQTERPSEHVEIARDEAYWTRILWTSQCGGPVIDTRRGRHGRGQLGHGQGDEEEEEIIHDPTSVSMQNLSGLGGQLPCVEESRSATIIDGGNDGSDDRRLPRMLKTGAKKRGKAHWTVGNLQCSYPSTGSNDSISRHRKGRKLTIQFLLVTQRR